MIRNLRPPLSVMCTALLAVCLSFCCDGPACSEELFPTRDENPLLRGIYLPLASDSRETAGPMLSAELSIANTLNVESRGTEHLLVDGESDTLRIGYDQALGEHWRYRLIVPVIRDSGGFLDTPIDRWHQWFGFSRGYRPYYPRGRIDYVYSGRGTIDLHHAQTSVGDVSADAGWYAADSTDRTVSFWAGVEAPTGSVSNLTSDGAWDVAAWSHVAQRFSCWQLAAEGGVVRPLGDELFGGAARRPSAFLRGAVTRDVTPTWGLRVQLDGQSGRVGGTNLRFLGPSLQMTVGAAGQLSRRWRVELGFAEDVAVNTAPDITFFVGIHD